MMVIFLLLLILFDFSNSSNESNCKVRAKKAELSSELCRKQLQILCDRSDILLTLWDSSTRILHTGLTVSTGSDLGNYDQCVGIDDSVDFEEETIEIKGKFCVYDWITSISQSDLENYVVDHEDPDKSDISVFERKKNETLGDNPNPISLMGSLCLPNECTRQDFIQVFRPYPNSVNFIDLYGCHTKEDENHLTTFEIIVTFFVFLIVLMMICSTAYHVWLHLGNKGEPHDIIKAFSMYYNGKKLIKINPNRGDQFSCMYGLRFLSMMWVVAHHSFGALSQMIPFVNANDVNEWQNRLYSQYTQAGADAVDTFFFLAGFLNVYIYIKTSKNKSVTEQIKNVPLMYLHRYLRLTPAVAALFFMTISFWKLFGSGPIWLPSVEAMSETCSNYWWRFFLYIQNYFPYGDMCWTHTWYLSADMQIFILAPIALIPVAIFLHKSVPKVLTGLSALTIFCGVISFSVPYIFEDYSVVFDTHSRIADYLMGMIGGVIIYKFKGKTVKINRKLNILLWILSICGLFFVILYAYDVSHYPTKLKTNLFSNISKIIWCLCIFWIVFSCTFGYGGIINSFLSNPFFEIGSRLSYCIYIVHLMVVISSYSQVRTYQFFSDYQLFYYICGHTITSIILAVFWHLAFEAPMIVIDKMLFSWIDSLKNSRNRIEP